MNLYIKIILILFLFLSISSFSFAVQIKGCHCFKNRQFDAVQPGAADPYILATTQNSFFAGVFGINKKQIVQAKMSGTSGDDLWIAHFTASKTGADVKNLILSRTASGSWKKALGQYKIDSKLLGAHFKEALAKDSADKHLSAIIVDQMIINHFGADKAEVEKLRVAGAQNKEIILSAFLSMRTKRSASSFYTSVTNGQLTWGKILYDLKIDAINMRTEINKILNISDNNI